MFSVNENQTDSAIRRFIKNIGPENVPEILTLRKADRLGGGATETSWRFEKFKARIVEVQKQEELLRTYHKINNEMETLGFPRDKREFHPHVTIARCKETFAFVPNNKVYKPFLVSQITLFQSTLTSRGSKYTKLNQINLGA